MTRTLATLPDDLLASIFVFLGASAVFNLYFCGEKSLCVRMCRSVPQLDLEYISFAKLQLTKLLEQFTFLKALRVTNLPSPQAPKIRYNLLRVPNTLTELSVPQQAWLFELSVSGGSQDLQSPVYNLSEMFPELKCLTLVSTSWESSRVACVEWIAKLPRSLTTLSAEELRLTPADIGALPRTLESLDTQLNLSFPSDDETGWSFPPDLRALTLHYVVPTGDFGQYMPTRLESLRFLDVYWKNRFPDALPKLSNFPRTLTVLEGIPLRVASPTAFDGLPPDLKRLTLWHVSIETADVAYPDCLKAMDGDVHLSEEDQAKSLKSLPAGMESIPRQYISFAGADVWPHLPRGLKSLTFQAYLAPTPEGALLLPPALTNSIIFNPSDEFLALLPTTLTSVALGDIKRSFSPSALNSLVNLVILDLKSGVNVDLKGFENFRPKLKRLSMQRTLPLYDLDLRRPWARQLTHFEGVCHQYGGKYARSAQEILAKEAKLLEGPNKPFGLNWWTHFPPTLTHLSLGDTVSGLHASRLDKLPRRLITLSIPYLFVDEDYDALVKRLPRSLQVADFSFCRFTKQVQQSLQSMEHIPPNMYSLRISGALLTD
jgi:hypothetical protein